MSSMKLPRMLWYPVPADVNDPVVDSYNRTGYSSARGGIHRATDIGLADLPPYKRRLTNCWRGTVIAVGNIWGPDYGKQVLIRHRKWRRVNGRLRRIEWYSFYAHLDIVTVRVGQKLRKRTTLGRGGNTGRSSAPHLHIELHEKPYWNEGTIYNPAPLLEDVRRREKAAA